LLSEATGDLDDIDDGTTYEKIRATDLSGGHIKLTSATVVDGEWYDESGVEIDASSGINIYGTNNALTTRATKTGTIQCKVDANGAIIAGAGAVALDAGGITITEGTGTTNSVEWGDSSGNKLADIHTEWGGGASDTILTEIRVTQNNVSAGDTIVRLRAYDGSTNVDWEVIDNGTLNGGNVTDLILNDGTNNWIDFGNAQDCSLILGDSAGSYEFKVFDSGVNEMFVLDSNGNVNITRGLHVGSQTTAPTHADISCDGVISTSSGESWNLGGTASGTITADTKIHVQIESSWYTIAAEAGLV
jgi:hypothetical protein